MSNDFREEELIQGIGQRLQLVREKIADAARKAGRNPEGVRLVVVTKAQPLNVVQAAIQAGATLLGENYIEEAVEKIAALHQTRVEWHLIGHLQSRKAEIAAKNFSMVHSLDSTRLAKKLDRSCGESDLKLSVLLEVNVSGEESKFGFPAWDEEKWPELLPAFDEIVSLPSLQVRGLMTMPPYFTDQEQTRPFFHRLGELQSYLAKQFPKADWAELSMGTSIDFPAAVEEGATFVRVGEAILGRRKKEL